MAHDPDRHRRRSIRLNGYDYSQAGAYFVTICTQGRACLFGHVADGKTRLNDVGRIVQATWDGLPEHYGNVRLDAFVVMPNHVHGIVVLTECPGPVGAGFKPAPTNVPAIDPTLANADPTNVPAIDPNLANADPASPKRHGRPGPVGAGFKPAPTSVPALDPNLANADPASPKRHGLQEIVRGFKTFSARTINLCRNVPGTPVWQRNYYEHVIRDDESLNRIRQYILDNPARWAGDRDNPRAVAPEPEDAWRL